jgi:hypothetical protein
MAENSGKEKVSYAPPRLGKTLSLDLKKLVSDIAGIIAQHDYTRTEIIAFSSLF